MPFLAHCFDFTNYLLPGAVSVFPSLLSVPDKSTVHYVLSTTHVHKVSDEQAAVEEVLQQIFYLKVLYIKTYHLSNSKQRGGSISVQKL